MREIVLDTETTGLDPAGGHRIVEIACIELVNRVPSGRHFQTYVNPERDMPEEAYRVHGLSEAFLREQPTFGEVADDLLAFLAESGLVIHNAEFDLGFLNMELERAGKGRLEANPVTDTVLLARQKFPGAPANLDALCRRFAIDNSARTVHGALLDAELLAEVYLELMGGRQPGLGLAAETAAPAGSGTAARAERAPRPHAPTEAERAAHEAFLAEIDDPLWRR